MEKENTLYMTCEYLKTPLGIQNTKPRFGWKVTGALEASRQVSYQILVYLQDKKVWDSGKRESGQSSAVEYEGAELMSRKRYRWEAEICVCGPDGMRSVVRGTDFFETGILNQEEWRGEWIGMPDAKRGEAPLIRHSFFLKKLPECARLYVSGLGYCETTLNGKRLDNSRLDPGWTDYNRTVLYRVYDAGAYLREGENVLGFELGEGWQGLEHPFFKVAFDKLPSWNSRPKVLCNFYLDEECIETKADGTWTCICGPVTENNIYDGEVYDANRESPGWNEPSSVSFREKREKWQSAAGMEAPRGILRSQIMPSIGEREYRKPVHVEYVGENEDYSMVIDFGQNMAGWAELEIEGAPGTKVTVRYAETINRDGTINQKNLRYAKAREEYIIADTGRHKYHPKFTYHGFRYIEVEMKPGTVIYGARAVQVCTGVNRNADFECSDQLINRIYEAVMRTEENNMHSVPTDCPQRDERLGWVNDMTARYENAIYNFDVVLAYEKWMQDLMDAQGEKGEIPDTAPFFFGNRPGSHVTSAFILIPWCLYGFTNDRQILNRYYEAMKRYVIFKLGEREENGLLPEDYFGEWAPPMTEAVWGWGENALPRDIPQPLVTTCFLYYDCRVMSQIAKILGEEDDASFYQEQCRILRENINKKYYRKEGYYATGAQGAGIMPLFLDIAPEGCREQVLEHFIQDIAERGNHLATGNQMTKLAYEVLVQEEKADLALELMRQRTYPSIGYMLEHGATTIWERWEELTLNHMNSHNHPMLGAFAVWLPKGLAGLKPVAGDLQKYDIKPLFPAGLSYVHMNKELAGGWIKINWVRKEKEIILSIRVPWNTEAELILPKGYAGVFGSRVALESGSYQFTIKKQTEGRGIA